MGSHLERARHLSILGRYEEAIEECTRELAEDTNSAEAFATRGMVLINAERYFDAERDIAESLRLLPDYAFAYYLRSFTLQARHQTKKALEAIETALHYEISSVYLFQLAALCFSEGRFQDCLSVTEKTLELEPTHERALFLRAEVLNKLGRNEESKEILANLLSINPVNFRTFQSLGAANLKEGNIEEAITQLRESRRLNPIQFDQRERLATAYGMSMWPFPQLDRLSRRIVSMSKVWQWALFASAATVLLAVLCVTNSEGENWSLVAAIAIAAVFNVVGLLVFYDKYATVVSLILARKDLDMRWHETVSANLGLFAMIAVFHALLTGVGILLAMKPNMAFLVFSLLLALYPWAARSTGEMGPGPLMYLFSLLCIAIGMVASVFVPSFPWNAFVSWTVVLVLSGIGSFVLGKKTRSSTQAESE